MNRNLLFLFLLTLACCFSCKPKNEKLPAGILSKEQMIPVLADIQLAESAIAIKNLYPDSAKIYAADYTNFIYRQHRIPKSVFEKSLNYYIQHPKDLDEIYTNVISELSLKEAQEAR
jgi:hypothetical protein